MECWSSIDLPTSEEWNVGIDLPTSEEWNVGIDLPTTEEWNVGIDLPTSEEWNVIFCGIYLTSFRTMVIFVMSRYTLY
jgi:hypothetical protein